MNQINSRKISNQGSKKIKKKINRKNQLKNKKAMNKKLCVSN